MFRLVLYQESDVVAQSFPQKVFHNRIAVIREDRFGVELDPEGWGFFVHDTHNGAVGGKGGDL